MKKVELPSGKILRMDMASFSDARTLYQSLLKDFKFLTIDDGADIDVNLFKDLFCSILSSKEVEEAIWDCFGRVVYDDKKIDSDSFDSEESRGDYIMICYEVAWYNISPFTKGLYAKLAPLLEQIEKVKNYLV